MANEVYVQACSGTLIDFLDEFEPALLKHMIQCSTLCRQKVAILIFERNLRPGSLYLNIDFAENRALVDARNVQSEHWSTDSYTLFVVVVLFLDVGTWNLTVAPLDVGAEVPVEGEIADEAWTAGSTGTGSSVRLGRTAIGSRMCRGCSS